MRDRREVPVSGLQRRSRNTDNERRPEETEILEPFQEYSLPTDSPDALSCS